MHFDCGTINNLIDPSAYSECELREILNTNPRESWRYMQLLECFYHSLSAKDQRALVDSYPWIRKRLAPPGGQLPLPLFSEYSQGN